MHRSWSSHEQWYTVGEQRSRRRGRVRVRDLGNRVIEIHEIAIMRPTAVQYALLQSRTGFGARTTILPSVLHPGLALPPSFTLVDNVMQPLVPHKPFFR